MSKKNKIAAYQESGSPESQNDDNIEIWHAIFGVSKQTEKFINVLKKMCLKHDIRLILTEQKK